MCGAQLIPRAPLAGGGLDSSAQANPPFSFSFAVSSQEQQGQQLLQRLQLQRGPSDGEGLKLTQQVSPEVDPLRTSGSTQSVADGVRNDPGGGSCALNRIDSEPRVSAQLLRGQGSQAEVGHHQEDA